MKNSLLSIAVSLTAILLLTGCGGTGAGTDASPEPATTAIAAETSETDESVPAAETPEAEVSDTGAPGAGASETGTSDAASSESPAVSGSPTVFFTSDISAEGLVKIYEALGWTPSGKTAVKISTGEPPASNYLRPELIGYLVRKLDGTIVECNTAYGGSRASSDMHRQVA